MSPAQRLRTPRRTLVSELAALGIERPRERQPTSTNVTEIESE